MKDRIYLSPPHMGGRELEYVKEAFESNWIAPLGPQVDAFEKAVAGRIGLDGSLALSSGTAAIHLCLKYLGVEAGDHVFCSDLTFAGSCNAIMYEKAIPVFIDSEPDSWNMSPMALREALVWSEKMGKLPKAIIIVDLYGQSADYDSLLPICKEFGIPVIEDAAEALGAEYKGKPCGSFGDFNIFSFNGNKIVTTSGGGMVVSDDVKALEKMKFWATQSREDEPWYEHKELGYNYRMSNICAAIGRGQMDVLDEHIKRREQIYRTYKEALAPYDYIEMMPVPEYSRPNYWLSVMTLKKRNPVSAMELINRLAEENIEARPVWKPMHLQPFYSEYPFFSDGKSTGEDIFERGICLPSGSSLKNSEQKKIIEIILEECR